MGPFQWTRVRLGRGEGIQSDFGWSRSPGLKLENTYLKPHGLHVLGKGNDAKKKEGGVACQGRLRKKGARLDEMDAGCCMNVWLCAAIKLPLMMNSLVQRTCKKDNGELGGKYKWFIE